METVYERSELLVWAVLYAFYCLFLLTMKIKWLGKKHSVRLTWMKQPLLTPSLTQTINLLDWTVHAKTFKRKTSVPPHGCSQRGLFSWSKAGQFWALVSANATLRASLSGTFLRRKDVVNQCLEFVPVPQNLGQLWRWALLSYVIAERSHHGHVCFCHQ